MKTWEIILYICTAIASITAISGIMRENKKVTIIAIIILTLLTAIMFIWGRHYYEWN